MKRKALSVFLTLTVLIGMFSVCSAFSFVSAKTAETEKFVADFSELVALGGDAVNSEGYVTAYTPSTDTTSVDGKLNNWMRERFASKTNYVYSTYRSWFGQKSDEISDLEVDGGNGYNTNGNDTGFRVHPDGLLQRVVNVRATEMLRRVDTLIPQFNGENVQLKNFKMTISYRTRIPNNRGAILVAFDEAEAGKNVAVTSNDNYYLSMRRNVTGSTLVLGNGSGYSKRAEDGLSAAAYDGWVFYDKKGLISATTVDEQYSAGNEYQELKLGKDGGYTMAEGSVEYKRFDTMSTDQWLTLTVEVKNGKATFTTTSEDGYRNETMVRDYTARGGFVSIGMSNRDYVINYVDIEEYDDNGNAVDYGTYHNQKNYGIDKAVEVFSADFTDVPDIHYVDGQYLYNVNHDPSTGYRVGLTGTNGTTATSVGAYASEYTIDVKDKALVDYLESKFDFYEYGTGAGGTMERWNAAGYYVDAEGKHLGSGYGSNGYNPATGIGPDNGSWMPGNGVNGGYTFQYPTMKLSGNKWLQIHDNHNDWWVEPFQIISSFKVKNADGTDAALKNFRLDLDFKLTAPASDNNMSPIFVKFAGYNSVTREATDGAMFAISYNGGYFLDDLNTVVNGSTFMSTNNGGAPYYTETANSTTITEAHLTLTVKNGTVTAVVTLADGTKVLDVTKNDIAIQNGLIQIGSTYAGDYHGLPYFGGVQVVRLDNEGNPIDFTDGDEGTFDAHFVGLTDVMDTCYYRNLNTKNNAIMTGKSTPWLSNAVGIAAVDNQDNDGYAFGAEDTNIVNYLNEKFDFYHAAANATLTKMSSPYQNANEIYEDTFLDCTGGQWKLSGGRWLRATFDNGVSWNDAYRKQMILVPKMNGEPVKTADQHLEFDFAHGRVNNGNSYSAALVMLRSAEVAKTESAVGAYTDGIAVRITHYGISVYDGTSPAKTMGHDGDDQFLFGGDTYTAHVSLDLMGDELKVKVTTLDGATTLVDQTVTVANCLTRGYTYFSVCNSDMAFADIALTPVKSNGVFVEEGEAVVNCAPGYELKAGSLLAKTADGSVYVPQRVGFRQGGDASRYALVDGSTISAFEFIQPTLDNPNIGLVGTSFNAEKHGLRFITRFTRQVIDGVEYVVMSDGSKYAISDYGMLLAVESGLDTTAASTDEDMVVDSANAYVKQLSALESNKCYDICDDYIDLSACIINMDKVANFDAIKNMNMYVRTYVKVDVEGQERVLYGDVASSTYYKALDVAPTTATMTNLRENNTLLVNGRHTITDAGDVQVSFGNAGVTIAGVMTGDITVDVAYTKYAHGSCRINVMVDGEYVDDVVAVYGENKLKVVTGLTGGYHTVTISKGAGTPSLGDLVFKQITYSGYLETPHVNDLQFMFLGDSITDTAGILGLYDEEALDAAGVQLPSQNIRLGYAALTSKTFGAAFTQVSFAGQPIPTVTSLFKEEAEFPNHGSYAPYEYGSGDNTDKDVVVINLGTNISEGDMAQDVKDCLTAVREKYPNAYIVWAYGMRDGNSEGVLQPAVEAWVAETGDTKTSYCSLVAAANADGGAQHPLAQYHAQAAEILSQHIANFLNTNA